MAGSRGKRIVGIILFIIAFLALVAFLFVAFADAENVDWVPGTGDVKGIALVIAIALAVIALLLLLTLLIRKWDRQQEEAEEAEMFFVPEEYRPEEEELDEDADTEQVEPMGGPVVPHDLRNVPIRLRSWDRQHGDEDGVVHPYHFPRYSARAVYTNDYIPIDGNGTRLKLSTLLAAPPGAFKGVAEEGPTGAVLTTAWSSEEEEPEEGPVEPVPVPVEEVVEEEPAPEPPAPMQDYYDYAGDVHDVIDVEGIGPVYADKLNAIGVETTARLCYEDPARLAARIDVAEITVKAWQHMAELMKVSGIGKQYAEALARAGIEGIEELKRRSPSAIAGQVNGFLEGLQVNVLGQKITPKRVEGWQKAAKTMRRTKQPIPER